MSLVQKKGVLVKIAPFFSMVITLSMIFFDSSMLPLVIPVIQTELSLAPLLLRWIINIYFLTCASLVIFSGKIGDRIGYRKTVFIGMTIFGIAAIIAGSATSGTSLLISRVMQGVAASLITPSAMSVLFYTYLPSERNKVLGSTIGISSVFLALGPFVAGLITQYYSWRVLFYLFVPFTVLGAISALLLEQTKWVERDKGKIDIGGFFLLSLTIGFSVLPIMNGQYWGWFSISFNTCMMISIVSLFLLYFFTKHNIIKTIDFSLFKIKSFSVGLIILFAIQFPMMNTIIWWIFFQKVLQFTLFQTGVLALIYALPSIVIPPLSGIVSDKKGYAIPVLLGHVLILVGISCVTLFVFSEKYAFMCIALFLYGAGISIVLTTISTLTLKDVPSFQRGVASGIYNTVRFGATAFAFASISSIKSHIKYNQMQELISTIPQLQCVPIKQLNDVLTGKEKASVLERLISGEVFLLLKQGFVNISLDLFQLLNIIVCVFVFFSLFISIRYFKNNTIDGKVFLKID
ncbi:MAG: MFS transporter [Chlamydiales bacterium]|nr:MFS transporter [Chlamydiales bacterium]